MFNTTEEEQLKDIQSLSEKEILQLKIDLDKALVEKKFCLKGQTSPIPVHLNTFFLTKEQQKSLQEKSNIIIQCIKKVVQEYYISPELQAKILLHPAEKTLFLSTTPSKGFGMMRLDAFYNGDQIKFVELNSDYPEGVVIFQNSCEAYDETLLAWKLLKPNHVSTIDNKELFYENVVALYKMNGGKQQKPSIALVGPIDRLFISEYELLTKFFLDKGHKAFLVEPQELSLTETGLSYNGESIHIVRRLGEMRYFRENEFAKPILEAYKKRQVLLVNDLHNRLWGIKTFFAILHDKNFSYLFSEEEKMVIEETIPKTWIVDSHNKEQRENFLSQKNKIVLKPNDDSEGNLVYIGKDTSDDAWRKIVFDTEIHGWTAQELIPIPKKQIIGVTKDGKKFEKELYFDLMIHIFMGKDGEVIFGNMGARTSESSILNVAKGGGINSVKIVEK